MDFLFHQLPIGFDVHVVLIDRYAFVFPCVIIALMHLKQPFQKFRGASHWQRAIGIGDLSNRALFNGVLNACSSSFKLSCANPESYHFLVYFDHVYSRLHRPSVHLFHFVFFSRVCTLDVSLVSYVTVKVRGGSSHCICTGLEFSLFVSLHICIFHLVFFRGCIPDLEQT